MTITVYLDKNELEIVSKAEYERRMEAAEEELEQKTSELFKDDEIFNGYLRSNYDYIDVWGMTAEQRAEVEQNFKNYCRKEARWDIDMPEFDEYIIDTTEF